MNCAESSCNLDISGVLIRTTLQPTNYEVDHGNPQDGQKEPTDRLYFPSDAIHLFLSPYS
jgi:hypothetical protein